MSQSEIYIVDDNPANLKLLENMLLQRGHQVRSFPLGRLALAAAKKRPPCLILLDVNMPEMNGYQVCEHLKSVPELASIPVIFLSALDETEDKLTAFQSGGVDYISKPFHFEEVHARVETHLKLHMLQQALQWQNEKLEDTVAARTLELSLANERLTILDRSKNEFLNLVSHEFRTPLNGLLGVSELILGRMPRSEQNDKLKSVYENSRLRILSILNDAMLLTEIDVNAERFKSASVSLIAALSRALDKTAEFAKSRRVSLHLPALELGLVSGDGELLVRALNALVETAVKFSAAGETIQLVAADTQTIVIVSHGRTIPAAALAKFFDVFAIGEAITPGGDLGLAPALAHRILSLFGGSVKVANIEPPGIQLTISLQSAQAREEHLTEALAVPC